MIFPSSAGMPYTKLTLAGHNLIIPRRGRFGMTSRLGTGKSLTFFTVYKELFFSVSRPAYMSLPSPNMPTAEDEDEPEAPEV
jgi:hypothetical protein